VSCRIPIVVYVSSDLEDYLDNNDKFWEELIANFPLIRHRPHSKGHVQHSSIVVCVFVSTAKLLPRSCLATKGGMQFTEGLTGNNRRDKHADTQTDGRDL
jgi:hypothetical protein